jgi:hypothetical protein
MILTFEKFKTILLLVLQWVEWSIFSLLFENIILHFFTYFTSEYVIGALFGHSIISYQNEAYI